MAERQNTMRARQAGYINVIHHVLIFISLSPERTIDSSLTKD